MKVTKEELLDKINELEVKADHYCRTDWKRYSEIKTELEDLNLELLDMYNTENEEWLTNQTKGA